MTTNTKATIIKTYYLMDMVNYYWKTNAFIMASGKTATFMAGENWS